MILPYDEPSSFAIRRPCDPQPPRRGDRAANHAGSARAGDGGRVVGPHWTLHPPVGGSLPGAVWMASRVHADSFSDLPEEVVTTFGPIAARVERAILGLGGVARGHRYRWGDGGSHFHVWCVQCPLGMLEASGMMLPLWEDVLPNVPDEDLADAARPVAAANAPRRTVSLNGPRRRLPMDRAAERPVAGRDAGPPQATAA